MLVISQILSRLDGRVNTQFMVAIGLRIRPIPRRKRVRPKDGTPTQNARRTPNANVLTTTNVFRNISARKEGFPESPGLTRRFMDKVRFLGFLHLVLGFWADICSVSGGKLPYTEN